MNGEKVFLIRIVSPEKYGGGETYQLMLAEELIKHGAEPYIVTTSRKLLEESKKKKIEAIPAMYIERQNWSGWRNMLFPIYVIRILRLRVWYKDILEKYEPNVINVQSRDEWIAATGIAKKMGIKVLWTDHMDFRSWVLTNINIWYKNWIGKWVLACAKKVDNIVMISDFERENFEEAVKPRKYSNLITIKNGVEDKYKEYKDVKAKHKSICFVGRIVDYKGVYELIKSFNIISGDDSEIVLNIYGSGEDFEKYKCLAANNKRIKFYGRTDDPLMAIAENEIFVLPSYIEGLSLSLLDALMMGKKIIASDIDGNPEVIINRETGLLVPVKNKNKLAEAILFMLDNEEQARTMSKNARRFYENNFDFKKVFREKMISLYNIGKEDK